MFLAGSCVPPVYAYVCTLLLPLAVSVPPSFYFFSKACFSFMSMSVCLHLCAPQECSSRGSQKRESDPLELELQMVVSLQKHAGN